MTNTPSTTTSQDDQETRQSTAESQVAAADAVLYGGYIAAACAATNAVGRPAIDLTDEEQKTKRLQMNRANAQRNRDRKKIMVDMLRTEKSQLDESNANLRKKIQELRHAIEVVKTLSRSEASGHQGADLQPSHQKAGTKRKLPVDVQTDDTQQHARVITQPQQNQQHVGNPYIYRNNVVNAMARNLLLQEQLLAHRLSHVPQFLNLPPSVNPLLSTGGGSVVNSLLVGPDARLEPPTENPLPPLVGRRELIHQLQNNVINQNQLVNLYYGGRANMGFLGSPSVQMEAQFQVPARSALLSSFTARGEADSLAPGLTLLPEQDSTSAKQKDQSMKRKKSDLL
jgi:bZIP transcription factor